QELLGVAGNPFAPQPQPLPGVRPGNPPTTSILLIPKEEGKNRVSQRLKFAKDILTKYDKDKNGKLSREEIGFPKEVFDAIDKDKDGELDAMELLRWVVATPDLEVTVRLGRV